MMIKRTERGWAGHFCGSDNCKFRRNTLLEGDRKIIVSTIGSYYPKNCGSIETIGNKRYYETMAFFAQKEGHYLEINVSDEICFDSDWSLCFDSQDDIPDDIDNLADQMHETVVNELIGKMKEGVI